MRIVTRVVFTTEYRTVCEVCGNSIVAVVPGPQNERATRQIGMQVELCPDCADLADISTVYMDVAEYEEAIHGTLNA